MSEEKVNEQLRGVFFCKVCGQQKMHTRMYGYRCHNPEHEEIENQIARQAAEQSMKVGWSASQIEDKLWEEYRHKHNLD